jgi:hypothetical protein
MRRRIPDVRTVQATWHLRQFNRVERVELEDVLGIEPGDEEKWHASIDRIRDFASGYLDGHGDRLRVEPILTLLPSYPWWTALSNHILRMKAWKSETVNRLDECAELSEFLRYHKHGLQQWIISASDRMDTYMFARYIDETRSAADVGETTIPLTGRE